MPPAEVPPDVLDLVTDGIIAVDHEWRLHYLNQEAAERLGSTPAELLGQSLRKLRSDLPESAFEAEVQTALGSGKPRSFESVSTVSGRSYLVRVLPRGEIAWIASVENTDSRRREDELRATEERLRLALTAGRCGVWDWDITANRVVWSEHLYEFHGIEPSDFDGSVEGFTRVVHPEDVGRVQQAVQHSLQTRSPYELEFRTLRPDGTVRWLSTNGNALYDAAGNPVRMLGATVDVTDRVQREVALKEEARRKDEFLAMLAHELRNPLAPIMNAVQILDHIGSPEPRAVRQRAIIHRQVRHLSRLLEDLLDVSRITRGRISLDRQPIDLRDVVRHALDASEESIRQAGLILHLDLTDTPVSISGDPTRLEQVLYNLINNAIRYTPAGGEITVSLAVEESDVMEGETVGIPSGMAAILRVMDTGRGIPPDQLGSIFELFTQLEATMDRAQGGLGIGLTLARNLLLLHGGTLEARSEGPGTGAEFVVRLPISNSEAG